MTHVTEFGLADCAGVLLTPDRSRLLKNVARRMGRLGLRRDTVACDGSSASGRLRSELVKERAQRDVIMTMRTRSTVPTCPRCAVLRDEALEGRLPNREVTP